MDDLIARIRAAIDEDERLAKAATPGPWRAANVTNYPAGWSQSATLDGPDAEQDGGADPATGDRLRVMRPQVVIPPDVDHGPCVDLADIEHMARHDPARVLLQVAAHRKLLDAHHPVKHDYGDHACNGCGFIGDLDEPRYDIDECPILLALAEAYGIQP